MSHPYGKTMVYQYSMLGKLINTPWKHYWKHGRGFRYAVIAFAICYPVFLKMHGAVNSPGNVQIWDQIREHRKHNPFAPPKEH